MNFQLQLEATAAYRRDLLLDEARRERLAERLRSANSHTPPMQRAISARVWSAFSVAGQVS